MTETNPSEISPPSEEPPAEDESTDHSPAEAVLSNNSSSVCNVVEPDDEHEVNSVDREDTASLFSTTTTTTRSKSPNTRKLNRLCRRIKAPKMVQPLYKYRCDFSRQNISHNVYIPDALQLPCPRGPQPSDLRSAVQSVPGQRPAAGVRHRWQGSGFHL